MSHEVQSATFDYSAVDADTTAYLKQNAQETRVLLKRTTEDIIRIGQNILEAKARLPHGQFIPWVKAELGISQPTAWRFMQVAQGKEIKKSFTVNDLVEQIAAPYVHPDAIKPVRIGYEGACANARKKLEPLLKELVETTTWATITPTGLIPRRDPTFEEWAETGKILARIDAIIAPFRPGLTD